MAISHYLGNTNLMNNYEKIIKNLTLEKLIAIEDEILQCDKCYCKERCLADKSNKSCHQVRIEWLTEDED